MTKHQLECIRQPPAAGLSLPQSHLRHLRGPGSEPTNQRPEWGLAANQKLALIESSVILISLSRQIHNQMLCAMFNWMTLWRNTRTRREESSLAQFVVRAKSS